SAPSTELLTATNPMPPRTSIPAGSTAGGAAQRARRRSRACRGRGFRIARGDVRGGRRRCQRETGCRSRRPRVDRTAMASSQLAPPAESPRSAPRFPQDMDLATRRRRMEDMTGGAPLLEGTRTTPVDAGGVPSEWVEVPGGSAVPTILYLHGGGYTVGSVRTHRALVARLAAATGGRGLTVDYRLGPEHPFPAAVDDAAAAYRWLVRSGVGPRRIVVAGDSAGGGLTVALLVALRDAGDPRPAAGVCISPWTDLACTGESMTTRAAADPMAQRDGLLPMAAAYLAGPDPRPPLAAPLYPAARRCRPSRDAGRGCHAAGRARARGRGARRPRGVGRHDPRVARLLAAPARGRRRGRARGRLGAGQARLSACALTWPLGSVPW